VKIILNYGVFKKETPINLRKEKKIKYDKYKEKVFELTEEVKHQIDGIENRGFNTYHIDHKISVKWGFENNIPEEHIAHIDNLQMLWWEENFNKNVVCEVDDKNKWIVGDLKVYENRADRYKPY
jgi:hypothetical protein